MFDAKTIRLAESLRPDHDFSVLGTEEFAILKIVENASGGGVEPIRDAVIENGIATFGGVVASSPLVSLLLYIPVTQTGSGTPSPTNIRDFVGVTGAVIGQTSGYGEYFRGLLNGTYGFVDLGSLTWRHTNDTIIFYTTSEPFGAGGSAKFSGEGICPNYERGYVPVQNSEDGKWQIANSVDLPVLRISDSNYTDPDIFKTAMQGVYLIYEKKEQTAPTITPQDFATLCQAFGITGNTYTISFGQTVYSAILDVLTGVLSITHAIVDLGDLTWRYGSGSQVFYTEDITDMSEAIPFSNMACSAFETLNSPISLSNMTNYSIKRGNSDSNKGIIYVKDTDYTDTDDFTTAVTGMKLVYELAEPIEIDITPTVISTLIGDNVIFADVGDITECKYTRK